MNRTRRTQLGLAVLAVNALVSGAWALVQPHTFFNHYPAGLGWVALIPPFNEHLVRDLGGLSLGFGVLFVVAIRHRQPVAYAPPTGRGWRPRLRTDDSITLAIGTPLNRHVSLDDVRRERGSVVMSGVSRSCAVCWSGRKGWSSQDSQRSTPPSARVGGC
jgi:hypothetical protein